MKSHDELTRQIGALQERMSKLCAAIRRINTSLDLDIVLQVVVDGARALTGALYSAITTIDEAGRPQQFLSSGITPEQHQQLADWANGLRLFERLRDLRGVLRLSDFHACVRSLGLSSDPLPLSSELHLYRTFLGTQIRHRDVHVGSLFLAEKEGAREFTSEDEEVLVVFASQAATAIANARTYRNEQRARADLEVLVDTSPIGVVVFDARNGNLVSLNREAKRIVERLRMPGRPPEQLLEVLACRLPDGREIALDEIPLARVLSEAETMRAEEMVLSVPDGRSVKTLVNVTPISATDREVVSVVVTMQDLEPLEELERMRAEFLGMVSHELRTPLTSIKGSTATVLGGSQVFGPAEMLEFFRIIDEQAEHMSGLIGDLLDAGRIETGTLSVSPEPSEVGALVEQARNAFLSGGGRHTVLVDLPPDLPRVMADRQRMVQVLNNLLSNAAKHSAEPLPIQVAAERDGVHVAISVSDHGRGIPPDRLPNLFRKYAGAGDGEYGIEGGMGLVICKGLVEAQGGRIWATSGGEGQGAEFTFTVSVAEEVGDGTATGAARGRSGALRQGRESARILVVDDDPQTLLYVRDALTVAGYSALVTGDYQDLSRVIRAEKPQLVLLDLVLPGTDGIELMQRVPELTDLPVIFISAYGRDETIARALETGAADYIVKPFSPTELTARIRAALRRRAEPEPVVLGDLAIDYDRRRVTVADRPVKLTATEYELLRVLSVNAGRVLTYRSLLHQVWSGRQYGDTVVRTFVKKIRQKLGDDAASPAYIFNERGVGYYMPRHRDP